MRFVKPTREQKDFVANPLATRKNIENTGIGIIDPLVVLDYNANAAQVNHVEEEPLAEEMEPSTANIVDYKLGSVGLDFKSFDPRVLR